MLTLALQTADPSLWADLEPDIEQWFTTPEVQVLPWGRLYRDTQPVVDGILQRAIALVQAHHGVKLVLDSTLNLENQPSANPETRQPAPAPNALALAEQVLNSPVAQTLNLVITQHVFWQLAHAGRYDLRLVAQLTPPQPQPKPSERISLFEVFNGEPAAQRVKKQETKTQFEQALFLYFLGFYAEAECLFADCLTLNPQDAVAAHYVECCHSAGVAND
ncbi:MAG: hypothetical protein AAGG51_07595 [Cyanobacteria bacterium P01_G01_bin.54]